MSFRSPTRFSGNVERGADKRPGYCVCSHSFRLDDDHQPTFCLHLTTIDRLVTTAPTNKPSLWTESNRAEHTTRRRSPVIRQTDAPSPPLPIKHLCNGRGTSLQTNWLNNEETNGNSITCLSAFKVLRQRCVCVCGCVRLVLRSYTKAGTKWISCLHTRKKERKKLFTKKPQGVKARNELSLKCWKSWFGSRIIVSAAFSINSEGKCRRTSRRHNGWNMSGVCLVSRPPPPHSPSHFLWFLCK